MNLLGHLKVGVGLLLPLHPSNRVPKRLRVDGCDLCLGPLDLYINISVELVELQGQFEHGVALCAGGLEPSVPGKEMGALVDEHLDKRKGNAVER